MTTNPRPPEWTSLTAMLEQNAGHFGSHAALLGDGLYYPLDRFDVSLAPGEPAKILRVEKTPGEECGWCLSGFSPAPGFVAAVVTERRNGNPDISV
jgi:hypothetical protein